MPAAEPDPERRAILLSAVLTFVGRAARCAGVRRIALMGSLATPKPMPKDADLLVTLQDGIDLGPLATASRRLKGELQGRMSGADIFLCSEDGRYLGRICRYRECHARVLCQAMNCGARQHLNDDLGVVRLARSLIRSPPFVLWPEVRRNESAPPDVESLLLDRLERGEP
jgi:hypothetical protein